MKVKKVLRDLVLIKPDEQKEETVNGIILPHLIDNSNLSKGTILEIGEGTDDSVPSEELSIGDKVLYQRNAGTELTVGDNEICILIKYEGIFSVIED